MNFIDTHAHLTHDDYAGKLDVVLNQAKEVDVTRYVVPGLDMASSRQAIKLYHEFSSILPAIGLHPLSATENYESFRELAALPEVAAIGEIGTDAKAGDWKEQEARFRFFLELAIEVNKPALIHIRDTWAETFKILADYPELKQKAVIHCFTGGAKEAEQVAKLGLLLSFTAIIARKNMDATHEVIKNWPFEQMMLETDCPWLSWPGESWPNGPAAVAKTGEFIAGLKGVSVEEVANQTTKTANKFFDL